MAPVRPQSTLGHYRILEPIGERGMGEVYAAEDTRLHRRIALKVLPRVLAADPERRLRFERDAQVIRYTLTFGVMGGGGLGFGAR
jgi:serine/threonine protein kinase